MLEGRTRIELKDVHTGKVDVTEEKNMVTNALQYIFNPMGYVKAADPMVTAEYVNYYTTLTGGLLLLNKTLAEAADSLSLPDVRFTASRIHLPRLFGETIMPRNLRLTLKTGGLSMCMILTRQRGTALLPVLL